jgi:RNA polymerase sigma-70 factor (ECF subfamily)
MRRFIRPKYSRLKDEELIDLYLQKEDDVALNKLLDRYLSKVYYVALGILKSPVEAQDASMEVLAKLQENLSKYPITNFSSWLIKVVRSHCFRILKDRLKTRTSELKENNAPAFMESPSFDALDGKTSDTEQLSKAVNELKEEQNRCIVAFYFQGLSYQEIVEEEGFTLNEVKSHIQNGKRNLRLQLTK